MDEKSIFEQQMKLLQTIVDQQQAYIQAQNAHMAEKDARMVEKDETIAELRTLVNELQTLRANLEETLCELHRQLFGTTSEKTISKEQSAEKAALQEEKAPITVKGHTRERKSKSKREELYANLPIREVTIPLTDEQRYCEYCNSEMTTITFTPVREEIRITPAKVERIRLMQEVAICPECKKDGDGTIVKVNMFQYLYMVLLYMPDYKNEPEGIEQLLPWSDFMKEHCTGLIDVENITAEKHEPLPI